MPKIKNKTGVKDNNINNINVVNSIVNNSSSITDNPNVEILETANENLLNDIPRLRSFFRQEIEKIITSENITYNAIAKDPEKIYPKMDVNGWLLVLDDIKHYVLYKNPFLFCDGLYPNGDYKYNYNKFIILWDLYLYINRYYGFIPDLDGFLIMTGAKLETFQRWSSSGRGILLKSMRETAKVTFQKTFLDSKVPIERIYAANNIFKMDQTEQDENNAIQLETLPDLLSITDEKKQIVDNFGTIPE